MSLAKSVGSYLIPYHAIYRSSDIVVICVNTSSNQCLFPGLKLQQEVNLLTQYRIYRYIFTTDISQIYRQVSVSTSNRRFQYIFWCSSTEEELMLYELNTVTYRVNCGPRIEVCVLRCTSEQDCNELPSVCEARHYNTYVDDIYISGDTVFELISIYTDLVRVLQGAGMEFKKWSSYMSNKPEQVQSDDRTCGLLTFG